MKTVRLFFIASLVVWSQTLFAGPSSIVDCSDLDNVSLDIIKIYKEQINPRLKEGTTNKSAKDLYALGITAFCLDKPKAGKQFMVYATRLNYLPANRFMGRYYMADQSLDASKKISTTPAHFDQAVSYYKQATQVFTKYIDQYPERSSSEVHDDSNMFIFAHLSSLYFTKYYIFMMDDDMNIVHYPQMLMALDNMGKTADQCLKHLLFYYKIDLLSDSVKHLAIRQYCFTAANYARHIYSLEKLRQQIVQAGHVSVNVVCLVDSSSLIQQVRNEIDDVFIAANFWVDTAAFFIASWINLPIGKDQPAKIEQIDKAAKERYCDIQEQIVFHTKDMFRSIKDTYSYMNHFSFRRK